MVTNIDFPSNNDFMFMSTDSSEIAFWDLRNNEKRLFTI